MRRNEAIKKIQTIFEDDLVLKPITLKLGVTLLTEDEQAALVLRLTDLFIQDGLQDDDEPNAYGIFVEDLIDVVQRCSVIYEE